MARRKCLFCGGDVRENGYCRACGLGQDFLRKARNTALYHYNTALDRARFQDMTGAVEALRMSLRYHKNQVEARNLLGLIYYQTGETVSALSQWVISANIRPKDNPAIRYLKELRDDPKTLEKANLVADLFNQALEHAQKRELDMAVARLKDCIEADDHFVKAYLLMALISLEQNRKGPARKYISRVIAIDRTNPIALHYLREMGESEESISRLAEEGAENPEELLDYYGMEMDVEKRPARKIRPEEKVGRRSTGVRALREQNLARFSHIYMLTGIIIGAFVFYFLIVPQIKRTAAADKARSEAVYSRTIATQDAEISYLEQSMDHLNRQLEENASETAEKDETISSLRGEVKMLREALMSGEGLPEGMDLPSGEEPDAGESAEKPETTDENNGTYKPTEKNAAAEKNNANMNGADIEDIEDMIANE